MTIDLPKHQSDAYKDLYFIENLLRISIHNFLTDKYGDNYFNKNVFKPFYDYGLSNKIIDIVSNVGGRINKENILLIREKEIHHIWFLDYRILISLLDHFWEDNFSEIFEKPTEKRKVHLLESLTRLIGARNAIAHNRKITEKEHLEISNVLILLFDIIKKEYYQNAIVILEKTQRQAIYKFVEILENFLFLISEHKLIRKNDQSSVRKQYSAFTMMSNHDHEFNNIYSKIISEIKEYNKITRSPGNVDAFIEFHKESPLVESLETLIFKIKGMEND